MNTATAESVTIGAPVLSRDGREGFVSAIKPAEAGQFLICGDMPAIHNDLEIVWRNGTISTTPDAIAAPWIEDALQCGFERVPLSEIEERRAVALQLRKTQATNATAEREREKAERAAFEADAIGKIPADAVAVIVAELVQDQSNILEDYHGSTTTRTVILAFSYHTRDLFPELRKAARNFAETADLADAPPGAEHRQKYSMGGGYYLKSGDRYSSGWKIRKERFWNGRETVKSLPTGEWSLAAPAMKGAPSAPTISAAGLAGIRIEEHTHTKKNFQMWIAILPDRVERAEFDRLRDLAQAMGGWYSRAWAGTPAGFAFKDAAAAEAFANPQPSPDTTAAPSPESSKIAPAPARVVASIGDKLRGLADTMQADIDHRFGDRRTNTPKRQREAGEARNEGNRLKRAQQGLHALAALHDAGTVPAVLARVISKKAAYELAGAAMDTSGGYYDAGRDLGRPSRDTPEAAAFWGLLVAPSVEQAKAEDLRRKIQSLQFANIPGYFPTPGAVIVRILDLANMPADRSIDVLEPEGGSGAILDAVRAAYPLANLTTYERHCTLQDILKGKGYTLAGPDFMEADAVQRFDFVLMNPPFENGQDIEHVRRAFAMVKDGGRLVAVMSPGPFYRQDRKATEFREWFEANGGERYELPAGSFKESGTGVGAVLVVMTGDAAPAPSAGPESTETTTPSTRGARWGTGHFETLAAARSYYSPYGFDAEGVAAKLAGGEIHIGPPEVPPGDSLHLDRSEGRYWIVGG